MSHISNPRHFSSLRTLSTYSKLPSLPSALSDSYVSGQKKLRPAGKLRHKVNDFRSRTVPLRNRINQKHNPVIFWPLSAYQRLPDGCVKSITLTSSPSRKSSVDEKSFISSLLKLIGRKARRALLPYLDGVNHSEFQVIPVMEPAASGCIKQLCVKSACADIFIPDIVKPLWSRTFNIGIHLWIIHERQKEQLRILAQSLTCE